MTGPDETFLPEAGEKRTDKVKVVLLPRFEFFKQGFRRALTKLIFVAPDCQAAGRIIRSKPLLDRKICA